MQRDDWLSHKGECEAVRSVTPEQPTPLMRLVCRVISVTQGNEWAVDQLCSGIVSHALHTTARSVHEHCPHCCECW